MHTARMSGIDKLLPVVMPLVVRWAEREERRILEHGDPLTRSELRDAGRMGVGLPRRIRVLCVDQIPLPGGPLLQWAATKTGLLTFSAAGMSLRYGIFVRREFLGNRYLVAHECVHTGQYERLGGIRPFLTQYIRECLQHGYTSAPLELEATQRAREIVEKDSPEPAATPQNW